MTTNAGGLKGDIVATSASECVSEEEALTQATISDELRLIDGIEIEANGNPILVEMAALAQSDDLVNTQRNIVAYESGLGLNAGHDLSLGNLKFFNQNVPHLLEVSIGHALICDALYYGIENTIQMYLRQLK